MPLIFFKDGFTEEDGIHDLGVNTTRVDDASKERSQDLSIGVTVEETLIN